MDLSSPTPTPNSPLVPVFGDNVQDLLSTGALNVNPTGIQVVNSNADTVDDPSSGVITLRDAINQANADNGQDLIVFDRSLFSNPQTITLSGTELDITHNLSIIAPQDSLTGEDLVTVSGNKATRVFEIESGAMVSIDGLIVADGRVTDDNGAGIKNSGTLTLDSSIVRGNSATGSNSNSTINGGGGIYNNGILTVTNSTISGNTAVSNGSGIYNNNGTVTIRNSTLNLNGNSSSFIAGGIFNTGTMNVSNSTISGNTAVNSGGIDNAGIMEIDRSTISNNLAYVADSGIFNSGTLTVGNSTISGNSALNVGSISNEGTVNVNNSIISGNSVDRFGGGGIYNFSSGIVNVNNSTISGNRASGAIPGFDREFGGGGGIYNEGTVNVNNSTLDGNSAVVGGGIYNNGILNVSNSTLDGNSASFGGGIYNSRNLTLVFSTLTHNLATDGGGVYQGSIPPSSTSETGSTSARNTIIAANLLRTSGVNPDVSGTFSSNGYNLIGDSTGSTGFDATGDIVGTSDNPIDPRLAPLDFYGGSTQTIALLPDSPAIGAGDPTVLNTDPTTDQRGLPRRAADGRTDIGAFEFSS